MMGTSRTLAAQLLLSLFFIVGTKALEKVNMPLVDGSVTNLDLTTFVENEVYTKQTSFAPVSNIIINVTNVPKEIAFILVQVHAYQYNVTLSYDKTQLNKVSNRSVFGSNIGVYVDTRSRTNVQVFLKNDNVHIVDALLVAVAYGKYAPIPGGCNMEFDMEIAPYQKVVHSDSMVVVDAQPASLPTSNGKQASCEKRPLRHEMYRMYISAQDFTPETYFAGIGQMLSINDILLNGKKISASLMTSPMRRVYSAYTGVGSVYAVVATYENHSAAYVPAFSYACSPLLYPDSCQLLNDPLSKWLCSIVFFLGVFSVFLGHRLLYVDTTLPVLLIGGVFGYSAALSTAKYDLTTNVGIGLAGAAIAALFLFAIRYCTPQYVWQTLLINLTLGYFCASIAYYNISVMENDYVFWLSFVCVMFLVSIVFSVLPLFANAVTCAIFGSYMMILPIDYFIGSNLKYILINVVRRQAVSGFNQAVILPPCQAKEITLAILWVCLALIRIKKQFCSGICCLPCLHRRNVSETERSLSERTWLLMSNEEDYGVE